MNNEFIRNSSKFVFLTFIYTIQHAIAAPSIVFVLLSFLTQAKPINTSVHIEAFIKIEGNYIKPVELKNGTKLVHNRKNKPLTKRNKKT